MEILLCEPKHFEVSYEINPWMNVNNKVNSNLALDQWNILRDTLDDLGVFLKYIEPQPELPDMVFTANAGAIFKNKVYLSSFYHSERAKEEKHWFEWFESNGYDLIKSNHNFEGAGDCLWDGKTMFMGYGFRSSLLAANRVLYELVESDVNVISGQLVDNRFYHLDTCFCPLDENCAIIYDGAFDDKSLQAFSNRTKLITVPEEEAVHFCCNAVVVDKTVVLPSQSPKTASILKSEGYNPIMIPMSEYIKSGGACKCLTLKL